MSEPNTSLLEFPCDFPIKALGLSRDDLQELVVSIVRRQAPDLDEATITCRRSGGGKYTSVTVVVRAQSQEQLDAIYQELCGCPQLNMVF
ncbi:MAG: YbeD family protein [Candidatus Methylumidiphilus sp.]